LLSQKSEDNRKDDRVCQCCWNAGLTGSKETLGSWWNGQKHAWAECEEERRGDEKIGFGKNETHRLGNEREREKEDEGVEHDCRPAGKTVSESDFGTVCSEKNTWTER